MLDPPPGLRPFCPPSPQHPTDPASTQFPPKHWRQEIWIQVPALPLTLRPWPSPAPSASVFTRYMGQGPDPSCLSHGLQLPPGPKATQYFIVQTHGRATGQDRGMGGEDNGYSLFCFFKEKYSLFRAYGNFQSAAVFHLSICLK